MNVNVNGSEVVQSDDLFRRLYSYEAPVEAPTRSRSLAHSEPMVE